jgi:hypothetical protein
MDEMQSQAWLPFLESAWTALGDDSHPQASGSAGVTPLGSAVPA